MQELVKLGLEDDVEEYWHDSYSRDDMHCYVRVRHVRHGGRPHAHLGTIAFCLTGTNPYEYRIEIIFARTREKIFFKNKIVI